MGPKPNTRSLAGGQNVRTDAGGLSLYLVFIATLKTELVHRRRFPDPEVASSVIFEYLEVFYNRCRSYSALSYRSAADYEEATMEGAAVAVDITRLRDRGKPSFAFEYTSIILADSNLNRLALRVV